MEKLLLIKYGELTTKKGNRKVFIKMLCTHTNSHYHILCTNTFKNYF